MLVETDDLTAHNGSALVQGKDVLDERLLLPLLHHHVGYLDHTVFLRLWRGGEK